MRNFIMGLILASSTSVFANTDNQHSGERELSYKDYVIYDQCSVSLNGESQDYIKKVCQEAPVNFKAWQNCEGSSSFGDDDIFAEAKTCFLKSTELWTDNDFAYKRNQLASIMDPLAVILSGLKSHEGTVSSAVAAASMCDFRSINRTIQTLDDAFSEYNIEARRLQMTARLEGNSILQDSFAKDRKKVAKNKNLLLNILESALLGGYASCPNL